MSTLSVVVVAHQSADDLARTLPAVTAQMRDGDELIVVDCGSTDRPERAVPESAEFVRVENLGFAGGAVVGAERARRDLLLFLNPDAEPLPGCLDALRDAPAEWGAWQALVLMDDGETVNTAGNVAHWLGIGWAGGIGEPARTFTPRTVGFASGAALVVRTELWRSVGGFEPGYFMYGEDQDLSLRLRLAGHEVGVQPAARVRHDYEFDKGDYKWFHLERNRAWTVLSVYPGPLLALLAPALLAFEIALLAVAARGGWLGAKLRAQAAVLRELPAILRRRRAVQARRAVPARRFAEALSADLDSPFLGPVASLPLLPALQRAYWKAVLRCI